LADWLRSGRRSAAWSWAGWVARDHLRRWNGMRRKTDRIDRRQLWMAVDECQVPQSRSVSGVNSGSSFRRIAWEGFPWMSYDRRHGWSRRPWLMNHRSTDDTSSSVLFPNLKTDWLTARERKGETYIECDVGDEFGMFGQIDITRLSRFILIQYLCPSDVHPERARGGWEMSVAHCWWLTGEAGGLAAVSAPVCWPSPLSMLEHIRWPPYKHFHWMSPPPGRTTDTSPSGWGLLPNSCQLLKQASRLHI
jgi:hypothetical protein